MLWTIYESEIRNDYDRHYHRSGRGRLVIFNGYVLFVAVPDQVSTEPSQIDKLTVRTLENKLKKASSNPMRCVMNVSLKIVDECGLWRSFCVKLSNSNSRPHCQQCDNNDTRVSALSIFFQYRKITPASL